MCPSVGVKRGRRERCLWRQAFSRPQLQWFFFLFLPTLSCFLSLFVSQTFFLLFFLSSFFLVLFSSFYTSSFLCKFHISDFFPPNIMRLTPFAFWVSLGNSASQLMLIFLLMFADKSRCEANSSGAEHLAAFNMEIQPEKIRPWHVTLQSIRNNCCVYRDQIKPNRNIFFYSFTVKIWFGLWISGASGCVYRKQNR